MKIGRFEFSQQYVLVIAEIGVNHDGSLHRALDLIDVARRAGADAIKLQVFDGPTLMHPSCRFAEYQQGRTDQADPIAMLQQYALDDQALCQVTAYARKAGLLSIATPFSPSDVARVAAMGCDAIKIASPDLVNPLLLRTAMTAGLPMIVSTGASTQAEIGSAVELLRPHTPGACLLHCVSAYPTEDADAHLGWIGELQKFGMPVGYSDHSDNPLAGPLAVAAGACVIEKHLTYDRAAQGPDHSASADERQFVQYVRAVRTASRMVGKGGRHVLKCEEDVRSVSRQSLVAARPIHAGEKLTADHFTVQRPGTGVPAAEIDRLIGTCLGHDLAAGEMFQPAPVMSGMNDAA